MALQPIPDRTFESPKGRVAVIVADFNREVTDGLLAGLEAEFERYENVQWQVHTVPGAFEIPLMAQKLASMVQVHDDDSEDRLFDVIVALGCVIKGDTYHFELIANESARGCMQVMLEQDIPVVYEVLAPYDREAALKRSTGETNHGKLAAFVALEWLEKLKQ